MTNYQKELLKQAQEIHNEIEKLNDIVNLLQIEYIKVSNELFDTIEPKKKTRMK